MRSARLITVYFIALTLLITTGIPPASAETTPVINEVMSSNVTTILDEDSEYSDWIEIFNPGTETIDLTGYGLSDREATPFEWTFSGTTIKPGEHLVVMASGKDRTTKADWFETVVTQGDTVHYIGGSAEPPWNWNGRGFSDAAYGWLFGPTPIGFGETTIATSISETLKSVYIRAPFTVQNVSDVLYAFVNVDYNDSFVAYLNGFEVARANIGMAGTPPKYNTAPNSRMESSLATGQLPQTFEVKNIQSYLAPGENIFAVQVNNSPFTNNLIANPFLTLGLRSTPQNARGVADWMEGRYRSFLHANFKISNDGETLFLTRPDGVRADMVTVGALSHDQSYGRSPDGGAWSCFDTATPGMSNGTGGYTGFSNATVSLSPEGGFHTGSVTVTMTCDSPTAVIRYTTDGSDPTASSPVYAAPVAVDSTTVIRARVFESGLLAETITTNTYFVDYTPTLPVISLSTTPANLFDDDIGIYVKGNSTRQSNFGMGNYFEDWERPIHIEFFETNGTCGFSIDAGVEISGFLTRLSPQKSLDILAKGTYGSGKIEYQIFPDLPITQFDSIVLRNGGNEIAEVQTYMVAPLCHSLVKDIDIDSRAYRPAVVFINGQYWGIHHIWEKQNEEYIAAHNKVDADAIDVVSLEPYPTVVRGDSLHYMNMIDFVRTHDMSDSQNYAYIQTQMDMDNFLEYTVAEFYAGCANWPSHNVKMWRPQTPDGKWRWVLTDLDGGLSDYDVKYPKIGFSILQASISTWIQFTYEQLFYRLLTNKTFYNAFFNRYMDRLNTIYRSETVLNKIHEFKSMLEPEMPRHIARWGEYETTLTGSYMSGVTSMESWLAHVDTLEISASQSMDTWFSYFENNMSLMMSFKPSDFNIENTLGVFASLTVNASGPGGKVKLNSLALDSFPWSGTYFTGVPVELIAAPELGYRFAGWTGAASGTEPTVTLSPTEGMTVTAVFEKVSDDVVLTKAGSPHTFLVSQSVAAGKSLTIEAGAEVIMAPKTLLHIQGELRIEGAADDPVTIKASDSANGWDRILIDNPSKPCAISHAVITGGTAGGGDNCTAALTALNADITVADCTFDGNVQCMVADGGTVTIRNCAFTADNRNEHLHILRATAVVEDCTFRGVVEEDAIDFDFITDGVIRDCRFFGTMNPDCDGIDIGDLCHDVLITGNTIYDCTDKGISVGEASKNIRIERNIIAGCDYGVAVKDSATVVIDHVTFFGNAIAVGAYEKAARYFGGGTATVTNSILAGSTTSALSTDALSTITVSYSLADTDILPGEGNVHADPLFSAPAARYFALRTGSPAIDAGNPASPADSDGSRADMGASGFAAPATAVIVINEINYNDAPEFDAGDWVEMYNPADAAVDLSGWTFKDENDGHVFVLPSGTAVGARGFLVLCRDANDFHTRFPEVTSYVGDISYGLGSGGELARLFDAAGSLVDYVAYDNRAPWPVTPDGTGRTLSLKSPDLDNTLGENWAPSRGYGTPGAANVIITGVEDTAPLAFSLDPNFPNPFNPTTTISFTLPAEGRVSLVIYSLSGQRVRTLVDGPMSAGRRSVVWDGKDDHGNAVSSGVYLSRLVCGENVATGRMVMVK